VTDIDDSHDIGGSTVTIHSTMQVADAGLLPVGLFFVAGEGQAFSNVNVAHFQDYGGAEGLGSYTATIDWGDGSSTAGTVSLANGLLQVNGSHTYAEEGGYSLQVKLTDEGGSTATAVSTVDVNDAGLSVSAASLSATEGSALSGATVASFTDAGGAEPPGNYVTTINWGDQTPTVAGTVVNNNGVLDVVGSHKYADEGKYTVTVSVLDAEGLPYYVFSTATVADAPLTGKAMTVTTKEGAFFSGTVASFTDAGGLEATNDYSVLINWGDGHKSAGLLVANVNGGYDVVGDHLYSEEGNYSVTVSVVDDGGSTATINSTAKVTDATLSAMGLNFSGTKGVALNKVLVGVFDDAGGPESAANYSVSIDWGDMTAPTSGLLTPLGTLFEVDGSHTYLKAGSYTVTITIKDLGGSAVKVTAKATIT
jgi:PKD repeat protein